MCECPILLDRGKLSFSLDKHSGKKCFMVAPRELIIWWGDNLNYWQWKPHSDSRFSEMAYFRGFRWLDIRGKIASQMLSKRTTYVVYLVFNLAPDAFDGLEIGKSVVRFVNCESDNEAGERRTVRRIGLVKAQRRVDEWMEIEMGNFFNDSGEDRDVEVCLFMLKIYLVSSIAWFHSDILTIRFNISLKR
nr:F-box protein PP2-B10-like isoform X1 [Nicotiana tomentosiformis]